MRHISTQLISLDGAPINNGGTVPMRMTGHRLSVRLGVTVVKSGFVWSNLPMEKLYVGKSSNSPHPIRTFISMNGGLITGLTARILPFPMLKKNGHAMTMAMASAKSISIRSKVCGRSCAISCDFFGVFTKHFWPPTLLSANFTLI